MRPSPTDIVLVVLGGSVGTAARALLDHYYSSTTVAVPVTLWINVAGAFVLGALLEALARADGLNRVRERVRLAIGTGVLGGFTTYSAFALGVGSSWRTGHVAAGFTYLALTLLLGGVATLMGILCARAIARKRQRPGAGVGPHR